MSKFGFNFTKAMTQINPAFLPFADAASDELPLGRLLRLSLFQVTVGMAVVLVIGTLNRVMIVELGVPAWLVAVMISLPLILAPYRAIIGFKSDTHRSVLGWRRLPYLWKGTLLQFGGLAIMPFALILLSGDSTASPIVGQAAAALAFLLVGAGLHMVQTIGLALATDIAPKDKHPQVVTLLCGMLLVGMVVSAVGFGVALQDSSATLRDATLATHNCTAAGGDCSDLQDAYTVTFNLFKFRLIQVIQAASAITFCLNFIALWKQEPRNPAYALGKATSKLPTFREAWATFTHQATSARALVVVGLGTLGFQAQDVLLEPFGGQILHLPVGTTTILTALLAVGGLLGFALAARLLGRGTPPYRVAMFGVFGGIAAFASVVAAAPLYSAIPFGIGTALIGFGSALFVVGTLSAAMGQAQGGLTGLALGTWGAVQAFAAGAAIALGGVTRDVVSALAEQGVFGPSLAVPVTGYGVVYGIEIVMLLATLVALAPLVRPAKQRVPTMELT